MGLSYGALVESLSSLHVIRHYLATTGVMVPLPRPRDATASLPVSLEAAQDHRSRVRASQHAEIVLCGCRLVVGVALTVTD